ncbi:MAG: hypothetical protein FWE09_06160 [Treponema sp.]|nr:hypothetical protein [Treponema sp.]
MRKTSIFLALSICFFALSCSEDNPSRSTYYTKSFFLGDTSFILEGEIFNEHTPYPGESIPKPFTSVVVRLNSPSYIEQYDGWETPKVSISQNRFWVEITQTANGITLGKDMATDGLYKPFSFPDGFPAVQLMFCFDRTFPSSDSPLLREPDRYSKIHTNYYYCYYVYVAEPIDLTQTIVKEGYGKFGYYVDTYNDDLNFPIQGWYKIVSGYHSKFNNDPKFSSATNNHFSYSTNF